MFHHCGQTLYACLYAACMLVCFPQREDNSLLSPLIHYSHWREEGVCECVCVHAEGRGLQCQGVLSAGKHQLSPTTYRLNYNRTWELCCVCSAMWIRSVMQRVIQRVGPRGVGMLNQDGRTNRINGAVNPLTSVLCENQKAGDGRNRDQEIEMENGSAKEESKSCRMCLTANRGTDRGWMKNGKK